MADPPLAQISAAERLTVHFVQFVQYVRFPETPGLLPDMATFCELPHTS